MPLDYSTHDLPPPPTSVFSTTDSQVTLLHWLIFNTGLNSSFLLTLLSFLPWLCRLLISSLPKNLFYPTWATYYHGYMPCSSPSVQASPLISQVKASTLWLLLAFPAHSLQSPPSNMSYPTGIPTHWTHRTHHCSALSLSLPTFLPPSVLPLSLLLTKFWSHVIQLYISTHAHFYIHIHIHNSFVACSVHFIVC